MTGVLTRGGTLVPLPGQIPRSNSNKIMADPHIAQKSPFVLKLEPGTYFWCACGLSKKQPYCDGSHSGKGFSPQKVEITGAKTVAWCGCKHSKAGAFCDGSHARL
jgi:CDGSH-type Zn-finger protein